METDEATLFDSDGAIAARDEAITRVEAHAPAEDADRLLEAIHRLSRSHGAFTTDDVWELVGDWNIREPRLLGALMKKAQKAGWIEPTSTFKASSRIAAHAGPKRVWLSKIVGT